MPSIIVTLKDGASEAKLQEAKQKAIDAGGKVTAEYSLIKGFAVTLPDDHVSTLETNEHLDVEADGKVTTQ